MKKRFIFLILLFLIPFSAYATTCTSYLRPVRFYTGLVALISIITLVLDALIAWRRFQKEKRSNPQIKWKITPIMMVSTILFVLAVAILIILSSYTVPPDCA